MVRIVAGTVALVLFFYGRGVRHTNEAAAIAASLVAMFVALHVFVSDRDTAVDGPTHGRRGTSPKAVAWLLLFAMCVLFAGTILLVQKARTVEADGIVLSLSSLTISFRIVTAFLVAAAAVAAYGGATSATKWVRFAAVPLATVWPHGTIIAAWAAWSTLGIAWQRRRAAVSRVRQMRGDQVAIPRTLPPLDPEALIANPIANPIKSPPEPSKPTYTPRFEPLSEAEKDRVASHVRDQIARGELQLADDNPAAAARLKKDPKPPPNTKSTPPSDKDSRAEQDERANLWEGTTFNPPPPYEPGQLSLPGVTTVPTVAERAFLVLARKWHEEVTLVRRELALPRSADDLALACLILAVEYTGAFTEVAVRQAQINRDVVATRGHMSWIDQLPWRLCEDSILTSPPSEAESVRQLTANLNHHDSSIRCWLMEIGWIVRSWLVPEHAVPLLLQNVGNTLGGWFMSAGLAAALTSTEDEFWILARGFAPPDRFEEQYRDRIDVAKAEGVLQLQILFWKREALLRKVIADAVLGQRLLAPTDRPGGS